VNLRNDVKLHELSKQSGVFVHPVPGMGDVLLANRLTVANVDSLLLQGMDQSEGRGSFADVLPGSSYVDRAIRHWKNIKGYDFPLKLSIFFGKDEKDPWKGKRWPGFKGWQKDL
jgi:hypothetical protein